MCPTATACRESLQRVDFVGAFTVATFLAGPGLLTLLAKSLLEWRFAGEIAATRRP